MLNEPDRRIIHRLCGDIGDGVHPFREIAEELGIPEDELLARLRKYQEQGIMRRFGAILHHQRAGFIANGMSVWSVPDDEVERVGALMAACPEVSHCYERPRMPDWPYNLFVMIHAHSEDECRGVAARIAASTGIADYDILFSTREFKKASMQY